MNIFLQQLRSVIGVCAHAKDLCLRPAPTTVVGSDRVILNASADQITQFGKSFSNYLQRR